MTDHGDKNILDTIDKIVQVFQTNADLFQLAASASGIVRAPIVAQEEPPREQERGRSVTKRSRSTVREKEEKERERAPVPRRKKKKEAQHEAEEPVDIQWKQKHNSRIL